MYIVNSCQVLQEYQYEAWGHLSHTVDGNQNQTYFETDGWRKINKVLYADGSEESYNYNAAGLITDTIAVQNGEERKALPLAKTNS